MYILYFMVLYTRMSNESGSAPHFDDEGLERMFRYMNERKETRAAMEQMQATLNVLKACVTNASNTTLLQQQGIDLHNPATAKLAGYYNIKPPSDAPPPRNQ